MIFLKESIRHVLTGFILLISINCAFGQWELRPLRTNPVIKKYLKEHPASLARIASSIDTVTLPFVDDFSREGIYPHSDLWVDSDAFINSNYGDRPPSIGVATLDGIDKYGRPHDSTSGADGIADYLTSRPIFLGASATDTTIWLSFFYQPQGIGDEPEIGDSLILEFKNSSGDWIHIWSVPGHTDTVFQRVNIHITDTGYLYNGFQFRFYNIATINGNRDQWNIDYVILATHSSSNPLIPDVTFMNPLKSLLNNGYQAMPWNHYKATGPTFPVTTIFNDSIRDIGYAFVVGTQVTHTVKIYDDQSNVLFTNSFNNANIYPLNDYLFSEPLNGFTYPVNTNDSADFVVKSYFDFFTTQNQFNDTNTFRQHFYNYYAYDDGTAEYTNGVTGNTDVKIAYKFHVNMQDTLRGLSIYWNPDGTNIHNKLFQLAYWDQVDAVANQDHLVYKMINQRPANIDSINGFANYIFDTLLVVQPGDMYIGFIQNEPQTFYSIGFDRNIDSHTKMFAHFDGYWYQSSFYGSWMMRPLFGDTIIQAAWVSVPELVREDLGFSVYPNPSRENIKIGFEKKPGMKYRYSILDITGREITTDEAVPERKINTSGLGSGIYFVRLTNSGTGQSSQVKLIIL